MNKTGIFWTKAGSTECDYEKYPPYPSYNALGAVLNQIWACYVSASTAQALRDRYARATNEILALMNGQAERIRELTKENAHLSAELDKWKTQQKQGKRPNKKIHAQIEEIKVLKVAGASNREIARQLKISEATVRRLIRLHPSG
jgi:DNA-binding NarL/FixJ family response regulator